MRRIKMFSVIICVAIVTTSSFYGCQKVKKSEKSENTTKEQSEVSLQEKDDEQYLNVLLGAEPKSIDPSKATDIYSSVIYTNTQECLTRVIQDENGNDKVIEGLAQSWEKSDDGLTWTFHLRDAKWSDGQPVTAEQFVYGITRTLNPDTASRYSYILYPIKNAQEYNEKNASVEDVGVKALDDKTLEIKLKAPCPFFLDITYSKTMGPQRKDIVEKYGDTYGTECSNMVYSGPFKISDWTHNSKVELSKNDEYWDSESVTLDKITMKVIAEESARMQELYAGSLDMAGVNKPEWIKKFDDSKKFYVATGYNSAVAYTFFNQSKEIDGKINIFSNAKVRKAFSIVQKREEKIDVLRKGLGDAAYGFVPKKVLIDNKEYRELFDKQPVQKLIDENKDPKALLIEGLKELGLGDDPSQISIKYLYAGTDSNSKEWAEYDQQNYEQTLGVKIDIEYVEWAMFTERTNNLEYQMASQSMYGDYNDPDTYITCWASNFGLLPVAWKNEKFDKIVAEAAVCQDPKKRSELFMEAEEILVYEDAVCAPEAYMFKKTYIANYIKNYNSPLFGFADYKYTYTQGRK